MEDLIAPIVSPGLQIKLLPIKIVFGAISLIFLILIFYFISRSSWLKWRILQDFVEFFTFRPFGVKKIFKQWTKIKGRLEVGMESEYKLAIIEADSMLDEILKRIGYSGETLGERLKNITPAILPNVEQIWQAHKIRNNIVHDPDYRLSLDQAKKVLDIYEETFKTLEVF